MSVLDPATVQQAYDACTWGNTLETASDWLTQLRGSDESAKKRIFKRLFLEAPNGKLLKMIFSRAQIQNYLQDFDKQLPRAHLERRRRVWRYLYLGERTPVPGLDWIIKL